MKTKSTILAASVVATIAGAGLAAHYVVQPATPAPIVDNLPPGMPSALRARILAAREAQRNNPRPTQPMAPSPMMLERIRAQRAAMQSHPMTAPVATTATMPPAMRARMEQMRHRP